MHDRLASAHDLCGVVSYADEIRRWLLERGPQIRGGAHDGGVLGWVGTDDPFVYPEVIGYYLTVLRSIADEDRSFAGSCSNGARRALDWLERHDTWRTRDYLREPTRDDWRNRATFTFDLGIILGGAGHWAADPSIGRLASRVRSRCLDALAEIPSTATGLLGSHTCNAADARSLPARWSTLPGPHHAKIAGLLEHAHAGSVPTPLLHRARATLRHWRTAAEAGTFSGELHPLLYFLEGLVIEAVAREAVPPWALIRGVLGQVMSASTLEGDLPEQLARAGGTRRSDIAAQALRLCVLASTGSAAQDGGGSGTALRERAARLCEALTSRYIGPGGAVHSFPLHGPGAPSGPNPPNVWAAIFTYQALRYHAYLLSGERVPMSMVSTLA